MTIWLFLDENIGTLATLVTALLAAVVALVIARMNIRATVQREAVSLLREAYADWLQAVDSIAVRIAEETAVEAHGWKPSDPEQAEIADEHTRIKEMSRLVHAGARVRILDPAVSPHLEHIFLVLRTGEWKAELGVVQQVHEAHPGPNGLVYASAACAEFLVGRVATRLVSTKPFRARREEQEPFIV